MQVARKKNAFAAQAGRAVLCAPQPARGVSVFSWLRLSAAGFFFMTLAWWLNLASAQAAGPRFAVDPPWTVDEGLPQSSVSSLAQTRDGYLWLGTFGGLARFDGTHFAIFDESNTPGLGSSRIVKLFEDSRGHLWIGTETAGVVVVDPAGKLTPIQNPDRPASAETRVVSICEDASGAVWLYTKDGWLSRYRQGRLVDERNLKQVVGGLAEEDLKRIAAVYGVDLRRLATSLFPTVIPDGTGCLLLGFEGGILAFDPRQTGTHLDLQIRASSKKLDYLCPSRKGGYWSISDHKMHRINAGRIEVEAPYSWPEGVVVTAACEDPEGNLFVGTFGDGVHWCDAKGQTNSLKGLSHRSVLSLGVDREGCLWVGTDGGLNRVKRQIFDVLEGTLLLTVTSVCGDGRDGLWVGYGGARVDHWTGDELRRYDVPLPRAEVAGIVLRALLLDRSGRLWAGAEGGGVVRDPPLIPIPGGGLSARPGGPGRNRVVPSPSLLLV